MHNKNHDFDRNKIYEKLDYKPKPSYYNKQIPWVVQQQISATNGNLYRNLIGKLSNYPIPNLPVRCVKDGLMLDIGSGWGRWLVAGAKNGYIPIGMDIRLEFCMTARTILKTLGYTGYLVVADLVNIPFSNNVFDLVWSFSVLQHVHKERFVRCIESIERILCHGSFCLIQFPNKRGIINRIKYIKASLAEKDNYNSWCVRYYLIEEYKKLFNDIFRNFECRSHSFIGLGILPSDLKYVTWNKKILVILSVMLSYIANLIQPLIALSDSIYVTSYKYGGAEQRHKGVHEFLKAHKHCPNDNLNIRYLLHCPVTKHEMILSKDRTELISEQAGLAFPIIHDIPIIVRSEARTI